MLDKKTLKKIILPITVLIFVIFTDICVIDQIVEKRITNFYREKFIEYVHNSAENWEKYEYTKDISDYQCGVINYGIAIDYFEKYYLRFSNKSNREYIALYVIYEDILTNIDMPKSYYREFAEYLTLFAKITNTARMKFFQKSMLSRNNFTNKPNSI